VEYKIHWEGYPSSDDTWCQVSHIVLPFAMLSSVVAAVTGVLWARQTGCPPRPAAKHRTRDGLDSDCSPALCPHAAACGVRRGR